MWQTKKIERWIVVDLDPALLAMVMDPRTGDPILFLTERTAQVSVDRLNNPEAGDD